jgi:hypothetical protein
MDSSVSLQTIKNTIPTLSPAERRELLHLLVDTFTEPGDQSASGRKRSLRELRGLGKHIWEGIDAQEYIDQQRDEWDSRP